MMRSILVLPLVFLISLLTPACKKGANPAVQALETDAGAAVVRQLVSEAPAYNEKRKMCIVLGPEQAQPGEAFLNRFPEYAGRLLKNNQVTVTSVGGVSRVMERTSGVMAGELVLLLQISELEPEGSDFKAVGAWAYKDDILRRRYILKAQGDGKFSVTPGEILEQKSAKAE